jgi:uncharacterized protein (TIGR04255 family)
MVKTYKRPPITEAVIELRLGQPISRDTIETMGRRLKEEYFYSDPETAVKVHFDAAPATSIRAESDWLGLKLSSLDRADILILRTNTFICSRLAPYPGWEALRDRARRNWDALRKAAGTLQLSRIGVRYINRIDVPIPADNVVQEADYLNVHPTFPDDRPFLGYAMQIVQPLGADDCKLTVNSAALPSPLVGHASLGLDIDIGRENYLPRREDELWALIDRIRDHKNTVFERCITDKARQVFDQ